MKKPVTESGAGVVSDASEQELEAIMGRYEQALLRYATRLLHDADAAQDVVQETFIRFFRRRPDNGMSDESRLRQWLYRTAHNAAIDRIRAEERRRRLYERHALECDPSAPPAAPAALDDAERKAVVLRCLHRLDPSEREVLILRLQEGLSYREIAQATGRRVGTVGCLLHTATRKLADHLRQTGLLDTR